MAKGDLKEGKKSHTESEFAHPVVFYSHTPNQCLTQKLEQYCDNDEASCAALTAEFK